MGKGKLEYKMGSYGVEAFYNTRFKSLYEKLAPENKSKFLDMPLKKKQLVIQRLIQKGQMI